MQHKLYIEFFYIFTGASDHTCFFPRGKGVGGSSLINGLVYTRGNKGDYNKWANVTNDINWRYENVLSYFKKSEKFTRANQFVPIDYSYHGYRGLLRMTQPKPPQNESLAIIKNSEQIGMKLVDYNGREQLGVSILQYYVKDGRRFDPEMAFIEPAKRRSNLKVSDKSYVTKIQINNITRRVEGVVFTRNNKTYIVRSRKEVVLSAGAVGSPQILMLSGIGPKEHLNSIRIPLIQDLPVGQDLREHVIIPLIYSCNVSTTDSLEKSVVDLLNGEGALTRPDTFDAVSFLKTSQQELEDVPDIEFYYGNFSDNPLIPKYYGWNKITYEAIDAKVPNPFALSLILLHPKSKGSIKLKTNSPFDYPLINPNMLNDTRDLETLYQGIVFALNHNEVFKNINASLAFKQFPGCNKFAPLSKDYWYCYMRQITIIGGHPVSSCPAGVDPKNSVVDSRLRIFGIKGLRVADASVVPVTISGHTNAVCTMVGEKVSDLIKQDHGQLTS